jgi:hypothetical protein
MMIDKRKRQGCGTVNPHLARSQKPRPVSIVLIWAGKKRSSFRKFFEVSFLGLRKVAHQKGNELWRQTQLSYL